MLIPDLFKSAGKPGSRGAKKSIPFLILLLATDALAAPIQVMGPRIQLSDVLGTMVGEVNGDLGQAPSPGMRRRVYRQQVLNLLGPEFRRRLPSFWEIETKSQAVTCPEFEKLVTAALQPHLSLGLNLRSINCTRPLTLPVGTLQIIARLGEGTHQAGRVPLQVHLQAGDWPPHSVILSAVIEGTRPVLVAAADLMVGTPLDGNSIRIEQREASGLVSDALVAAEEISGKKLILNLRSGTILRRGFLVDIPLIPKGDMVTISVSLNGLRVTSRGLAREEGKRGDIITVLSLSSNKLIKARVVDPHQVSVDL